MHHLPKSNFLCTYETSLEHLGCSWLPWRIILSSSSVGKVALLPIWLRALSKMALINERTPIPYSSPIILIKSQEIYNKGRLLQGHGHKFVRMGRTGAIPQVRFGRSVVSTQFVQILHVSQEHAITIQSLHHQAISNAPIYTGRRGNQGISGKYMCAVTIATDGSNWGAKSDLKKRQLWVRHLQSSSPSIFSATDCFIPTSCTHMATPKHKIGGWVDK